MPRHDPTGTRRGRTGTRAVRLMAALRDRRWHSTRELVRRVGHTFASAKHWLVKRGTAVARDRDPRRPGNYRYRLT